MYSRGKIRVPKFRARRSKNRVHRERGAELLELALVLPFLLVILAGVIRFGEAWALKDQLTGAARDGARTAVADFNDTTNPQCGGTPCSVQAAASVTVAALANANVDTCGMDSTGGGAAGATAFSWVFTSNNCAASGQPWTIDVEREVPFTVDGTTILSTRVTVSYPFQWNLADVAGLLGGSSTFTDTITLSSAEMMSNLN